ncbi:MAG: bZIP transcription factor [Spirochaetaceae bacterium]|nr:bZIP transcription factor [Spirochaetaceae bacterium]
MEDILIPVVAIISVFIGFPGILFSFISSRQKRKTEIQKLEYETRKLELEIEKQNNQLKLLEEENKKYDKIIYG